jgi:hypothetical protein
VGVTARPSDQPNLKPAPEAMATVAMAARVVQAWYIRNFFMVVPSLETVPLN